MNNPTYDAEGNQIWKPQPGEHYTEGLKTRESFGGIIAAVGDVQVAFGCGIPKAYPENFGGIIAAIEDLSACLRLNDATEISVGSTPPGWSNAVNGDGSPGGTWLVPPTDGTLWFDTRQGRLMVAADGEYWQTNGAEGLAFVGENAPTATPVLGQSWYDTYNKLLYICTTPGQWEAVRGAVDVAQSTGDVPITFPSRLFDGQGNGYILPSNFPAAEQWSSLLPDTDTNNLNTQADLNEFYLWSLVRLADCCETGSNTYFQSDEPTCENCSTLSEGDIWYDRSNLDLKVFDGYSWISATHSATNRSRLAAVENAINLEISDRNVADINLRADLQELIQESAANNPEITGRIDALENEVDSIPRLDEAVLAKLTDIETARASLQTNIDAVQAQIPDLNTLQTVAEADSDYQELDAKISLRATQTELQQAIAQIPDVSNFATDQDVVDAIANITIDYLPRTGGSLTGTFTVDKADAANPSFDFSGEKWYSYNTHKYRTNSTDANYSTFGTNANPWEYAWSFGSNEDFCWVNGSGNKVFSISKDGPACNNLILGDFQPNDATNGRTLTNQIDVKAKLTEHTTTLATHTQQISDLITGTYTNDSGVIYSDNAPTGVIDDGALWFDSHNIRLNVRHQGAWIYPDRVEDTALKTALFNAISGAEDFATLKIKLLAALV